jgi:hypothetical protein
MAPELTVVLCALVALASLWLGYALGRAEFRERLRHCQRERDEARARVLGLERQAAPNPPGGVSPGKGP